MRRIRLGALSLVKFAGDWGAIAGHPLALVVVTLLSTVRTLVIALLTVRAVAVVQKQCSRKSCCNSLAIVASGAVGGCVVVATTVATTVSVVTITLLAIAFVAISVVVLIFALIPAIVVVSVIAVVAVSRLTVTVVAASLAVAGLLQPAIGARPGALDVVVVGLLYIVAAILEIPVEVGGAGHTAVAVIS